MSYKILNGNELLIQGALEAGFNLYTGYPGSPLADFFNILHESKKDLAAKGIKVVIANSEANAAAMASGAKMAGQHVLVAMKSMGLHVAADALSVGNFANPGKGGVVIAVGDDPWSISTSTPADSRYLFKHLHIPFLEPSTPQELKDWMKKALELSEESSVYAGILLTTHMAEGGGRVEVYPEKKVSSDKITLNPSEFNLSTNVMVPPNSLLADREMIERRFPRVLEAIQKLALDKTFGNTSASIGIVSSGAAFETLKQVLEESKLMDEVALYKAASSYPLNENQLLPFLKDRKSVIVVEEKRDFLESEIKNLIQRNKLSLEVLGKLFPMNGHFIEGFPAYGGLSYELIYKNLIRALDLLKSQGEEVHCEKSSYSPVELDLLLPKRLPTFCPGCPHRETLSIMKDVRKSLAGKDVNLISHGDVGCYSLSFLEPFKEMHDLSAMGQGGALGAGTDIFTTNPSVVLMGDSTFFHSGMTAISNSVQLGHNITYILLDNDNTAMTGHQVTPRTGISVDGVAKPRQSMQELVSALRVDKVTEVNPSDRYFYLNLLSEYVTSDGVKVIISNKECGLTFHGRKKREERKIFSAGETQKVREFYQINTLACEDCRACVEMTGCPGLSQSFDAYGTKVNIDPQICVSDSYCTKIKACPSFELVKVHDYHPTKYQSEKKTIETGEFFSPVMKKALSAIAGGEDFRAVIIGVGGSGVTTISRVLAEASSAMGGRDDLDFKFVDQKGLAQRNGSVMSHLSVSEKSKSMGPILPLGSADLVLSPDLLEGARAIQYLSKSGMMIIDSDFQVPLSILLDRGIEKDVLSPEELRLELQRKLGDKVFIAPFKNISYDHFGKSVYASAMILGAAFQKGLLPFSLDDLTQAIAGSVPRQEKEANLMAFEMGRKIANGSLAVNVQTDESDKMLMESISLVAYPWQRAEKFRNILTSYSKQLTEILPDLDPKFLKRYVHDLLVFDQGEKLHSYFEDIRTLKSKYEKDDLILAIQTLTRTYWIKDEVFVSHLMISPLKTQEDDNRYLKLGSSYEVVHINRPGFDIMGRKIEFDFSPRPWMLKIMRHLRILRRLLPDWHKKERQISSIIRSELLTGVSTKRLRELAAIKGYREIRYALADKYLGIQ